MAEKTAKEKIGFIGLGAMGQPMARRLLEAGYALVVYDLRPEAMEVVTKRGAESASSVKEVAQKCRKMITIVPNSEAVEKVVLGPQGLLEGAKAGDILIEMTSAYPPSTLKISQALSARGILMIDAPVSGGVIGAEAGTLAIMVGGEEKVFESCRPILSVMGKNLFYMGGIGSGHTLKAINNFLSATAMAATSEAVILAAKLGLSPQRVIEVLQVSTGRSYSTELKFPKFVLSGTYNSGFSMELMYKDIDTVTRMAREYKIPMFMANMVHQLFGYAMAQGGGKGDHTAIFKYLEELAKEKRGK
ncbi:MAG: NAD(P)-dependent oxidoreductase [Deltaproteobacteria bacterium]|nr:NAD(P)-dependent oxidoreductase [Deltaproteobacteria bacterium]